MIRSNNLQRTRTHRQINFNTSPHHPLCQIQRHRARRRLNRDTGGTRLRARCGGGLFVRVWNVDPSVTGDVFAGDWVVVVVEGEVEVGGLGWGRTGGEGDFEAKEVSGVVTLLRSRERFENLPSSVEKSATYAGNASSFNISITIFSSLSVTTANSTGTPPSSPIHQAIGTIRPSYHHQQKENGRCQCDSTV
ncbi:hypothetical protein BC829DRAFT_408832 [Chytridium lagenaria]|nr:hypothetical protein BC829DRAFT_408832 [Chytridium lagenaria]